MQQSAFFSPSPVTAYKISCMVGCPFYMWNNGGMEVTMLPALTRLNVIFYSIHIVLPPPLCHLRISVLSLRRSSKVLSSGHPSLVLNVPHTLLVPTEL